MRVTTTQQSIIG